MTVYRKQVYVWNEPQPRCTFPPRLRFRALAEVGEAAFIELLGRVLVGSLDTHDRRRIEQLGAEAAARRFFHEARPDFDYQPEWWVVGVDADGAAVGLVQPVVFPGCVRDGLDEGTIYYIGVHPQQRGRQYGYDLLCHATATLQQVGVWRIYCDTDVHNLPMQRTFARAGYQTDGTVREYRLE
ncbi:MAG TPA: GNAT family N-acetyltransferase [Roseiflexaceae bacterium]|nr:GNAT family N-acetyltransferase [Roseiflexaceae bacterium]